MPPRSDPDDETVEIPTVVGVLTLPRHDLFITPALAAGGIWEWRETRYVAATLRPGQTFVDVGAHVGYYSVLATIVVGAEGRVIAFEPEPRNLAMLRQNLARTGHPGVTIIPAAATDQPGRMALQLDEENRGGHYLVERGEAETEVDCVRPDDVLPERVDFVKIDAQGFDHDVVAGLERTIAANPDITIMVELSRGELKRRHLKEESVLDSYVERGFSLGLFDAEGAIRTFSAETVANLHRSRAIVSDINLVLRRVAPPPPLTHRPARVEGLAAWATEAGGATVYRPNAGEACQLDAAAAAVLELCTGDHDVDEIVSLLGRAGPGPGPTRAEVAEQLEVLHTAGLIV